VTEEKGGKEVPWQTDARPFGRTQEEKSEAKEKRVAENRFIGTNIIARNGRGLVVGRPTKPLAPQRRKMRRGREKQVLAKRKDWHEGTRMGWALRGKTPEKREAPKSDEKRNRKTGDPIGHYFSSHPKGEGLVEPQKKREVKNRPSFLLCGHDEGGAKIGKNKGDAGTKRPQEPQPGVEEDKDVAGCAGPNDACLGDPLSQGDFARGRVVILEDTGGKKQLRRGWRIVRIYFFGRKAARK